MYPLNLPLIEPTITKFQRDVMINSRNGPTLIPHFSVGPFAERQSRREVPCPESECSIMIGSEARHKHGRTIMHHAWLLQVCDTDLAL
jgi:hypothetical protein